MSNMSTMELSTTGNNYKNTELTLVHPAIEHMKEFSINELEKQFILIFG